MHTHTHTQALDAAAVCVCLAGLVCMARCCYVIHLSLHFYSKRKSITEKAWSQSQRNCHYFLLGFHSFDVLTVSDVVVVVARYMMQNGNLKSGRCINCITLCLHSSLVRSHNTKKSPTSCHCFVVAQRLIELPREAALRHECERTQTERPNYTFK